MTRKRNTESEIVVSTPGSSAAPARRKTSGRNRSLHAAAPAETTVVSQPDIANSQVADGAATYEPSHEEIAAVAYLYWEARGGQGGSAEEDWLRAEQELRVRTRSMTA